MNEEATETSPGHVVVKHLTTDEVWERATWYGVRFVFDGLPCPTMCLLFRDLTAAREIFRRLRRHPAKPIDHRYEFSVWLLIVGYLGDECRIEIGTAYGEWRLQVPCTPDLRRFMVAVEAMETPCVIAPAQLAGQELDCWFDEALREFGYESRTSEQGGMTLRVGMHPRWCRSEATARMPESTGRPL